MPTTNHCFQLTYELLSLQERESLLVKSLSRLIQPSERVWKLSLTFSATTSEFKPFNEPLHVGPSFRIYRPVPPLSPGHASRILVCPRAFPHLQLTPPSWRLLTCQVSLPGLPPFWPIYTSPPPRFLSYYSPFPSTTSPPVPTPAAVSISPAPLSLHILLTSFQHDGWCSLKWTRRRKLNYGRRGWRSESRTWSRRG